MDAYSGYNQIMMHLDDQEKTFFVIEHRIFCYKVITFRLKNVGATYQQLDNKMFTAYLSSTMEVYINDILIKSLHAKDHIAHLQQPFEVLDQHQMKLNSTKCTFGVGSRQFF